MNDIDVEGSSASSRNRNSYAKPRLERLGTLRELTQCGGSLLDWLLGRNFDRCALTGSSSHTWQR